MLPADASPPLLKRPPCLPTRAVAIERWWLRSALDSCCVPSLSLRWAEGLRKQYRLTQAQCDELREKVRRGEVEGVVERGKFLNNRIREDSSIGEIPQLPNPLGLVKK